jgi:hypothetical protein
MSNTEYRLLNLLKRGCYGTVPWRSQQRLYYRQTSAKTEARSWPKGTLLGHRLSRWFLGGWLVAHGVGCQSDAPPPQPSQHQTSSDSPASGQTVNPPHSTSQATPANTTGTLPSKTADEAEPGHEWDPNRHVLSTRALRGRLGGVAVQPEASIEGEYLIFRVRKDKMTERALWIKLRNSPSQPLPQGRFVYGPQGVVGEGLAGMVPEIILELPGQPLHLYPPGQYSLTLELGPRQKGQVHGKLHVSLGDAQQSFLAGSFTASAPRQPTEPPGVEDVPLINGTVVVRNASPGTVLMTGYAAHPSGDNFPLGAVEIELGTSAEPLRWEQRDYDQPRITSLIAGDVSKTPSQFEHSRLTPGRYIVFARLKNGPAVWQWVDVGAQTTRKVELMLDAQQTGGLEVIAPVGALGKVHLAPADPQRPFLEEPLLLGLALQLGLEQDLVLRKALFKNLGPGTYIVRIGGETRTIEIVAGKTVELDFDKR